MSLILSVETSTNVCSVALTQHGQVLATEKLFLEKSHANLLTLVIESVLNRCNVKADQLNAVALSVGPGSYTGLRIGTSTAKGLCYALDIPLIGISTLEAMAYEVNQFNTENFLLVPMIDARRMEVYTATYTSELKLVDEVRPLILDENSFGETLNERAMLFFGNGSQKFSELIGSKSNAKFIDEVTPSAWAIGSLATVKFDKEDFEDVAYFEPFYLKEFQATVPKSLL